MENRTERHRGQARSTPRLQSTKEGAGFDRKPGVSCRELERIQEDQKIERWKKVEMQSAEPTRKENQGDLKKLRLLLAAKE
jgi:hypothetical protein